jgi:hypothetical protein
MAENVREWLDHDYAARNDQDVAEMRAECGAAGYGVYWMLVESMAESTDGWLRSDRLAGLAKQFDVSTEVLTQIIRSCIDNNLFIEEDGRFTSNRIQRHKRKRHDAAEKARIAAETRWGKKNGMQQASSPDEVACYEHATSMPQECSRYAEKSRVEESREEKRREEEVGGDALSAHEGTTTTTSPPNGFTATATHTHDPRYDPTYGWPDEATVMQFATEHHVPLESARESFRYFTKVGWRMKNGLDIRDWRIALVDNVQAMSGIPKADTKPLTEDEMKNRFLKDPRAYDAMRPVFGQNGARYWIPKDAPLRPGMQEVQVK